MWLTSLGTVSKFVVIEHGSNGFEGLLASTERKSEFGSALAALPRYSSPDLGCTGSCAALLAVGAQRFASVSNSKRGAVFILALNGTGDVLNSKLIDAADGAPISALLGIGNSYRSNNFGMELAWIGDANGDGWNELAVTS